MSDFNALYRRYAPLVHRFALCLGGDHALADDITSETFIRVWTSDAPIRHDTVKAYLFTIARNLYRDSLRRSRGRAELDSNLEDRTPGIAKRLEDRLELEFVLSEIAKLPEDDRAALIMRGVEHMSYEEISRALGLSLSVVKVKIHRARQRLMRAKAEKESMRSHKG